MIRALWGTVGTWFNFARGPCLWLALGAAVVGGAGGGWLAKSLMDGRVARAELETAKAEKNLSDFRGDLESAKVLVLQDQARLQHEATKATAEAIERGIARLSGEIAMQSDRAALTSLEASILNLQKDARYACRNLPLPADYLDGMRIPRLEAGATVSDGR